ncbi:MAG: hypothetical protein CVU41_07570 [Chloroflexi bacterium HGW-Chloroflexi-3]|nr:MAG: hypothetical protein CVU41_07570 [Chloroflexi bacterium HGW-Chloroflexi-3]
MIKQIILGVLFVGLSGFLIFGAVNRTLAKTNGVRTEVIGGGRYQSEEIGLAKVSEDENPYGRNQSLNRSLNRSETDPQYGNGGGSQVGDRTGVPDPQATAGEWAEYEGNVISIDSSMILVETDDGSEIVIEGRALVFMQDSGFVTHVGNTLFITGFYEDDEYKVTTIIDHTTGKTIVVRDEGGRPVSNL